MAATAPRRTARPLVRWSATRSPDSVSLEVVAREAGIHPDLARHFVSLGLLEPVDRRRPARFPRDSASRLARATRLRRDLGLNYAGAVLACELLARIDELQERLSRYEAPPNLPR
jgi:hypothetical protein